MATISQSQEHEYQRLIISQLIRDRSQHAELDHTKLKIDLKHWEDNLQHRSSPESMHQSDRTWGLINLGLCNLHQVYRNLTVSELVEHALMRGEGQLAGNGALCVETGKYTGRSPEDRFIVDEPGSHDHVAWGSINRPISEANFDRLYQRMLDYVQWRDLYIFDGFVGADPNHRFAVRVVNEFAWHNLFVHQLFCRPTATELATHQADFTVISVPGLQGDPALDGLHSEAFILLHLSRRLVLIGGTQYAGEMKKSIFAMLNYIMPDRQVLPMHGAANMAENGQTALFFGLSGTGKTTLSADPDHRLIGDDEHGWSETGVFNFEGGCYAKTIRLSQAHEPQIWDAIRFGTVLENVVMHADRSLDYDDDHLTENTRAAYPLDYIANAECSGLGNHPDTLFFLTADAFGVLPPIARLTREQAMYHFLSGYTSKLAGTERGITSPQTTFSACFGQCFFPRPATVYAEMLGDRLRQHPQTHVYLINTGWSGGPYGVGTRISIQHTRRMVAAALNGSLDQVRYTPHPIFRILVPETVPGVPQAMLDPKSVWPDPEAYEQQARYLAAEFARNFRQFTSASLEIRQAGPVG